MPKRVESEGDVSLRELQDIVDRLGAEIGKDRQGGVIVGDASEEAGAVLKQVHALRTMLRELGPKAPACFADRIVAAALEIDPVPDPATIHRLKD